MMSCEGASGWTGRPQGADGLSSEMYRRSPFVVNSWRAAQVLAIRKTGCRRSFFFGTRIFPGSPPFPQLSSLNRPLRPWKAWKNGFHEGIRDGCLFLLPPRAEKGYGFPWITPAAGMEKPWTVRAQVLRTCTHTAHTFPTPSASAGVTHKAPQRCSCGAGCCCRCHSRKDNRKGKSRKAERRLTAREEGHVAEACARRAWVTGGRGQG